MIKIAILGGNGQVGAEVASYLSLRSDVALLCLVRSQYSTPLFRLLSIPYAIFDPQKPDTLPELLHDCDMVVDATYPGVELSDIPRTIRKNMQVVIQSMAPGRIYAYLSSIMAFGMPNDARFVRKYTWCRTSYASIKRSAERHAWALGRRYGVQVFNLRLGQVHGVLQRVTQEYMESVAETSLTVLGKRSDYTTTVFACSVSEALLRCASGSVRPGLYTVVSSPQWTLGDLYDYYLSRSQATARVRFSEPEVSSISGAVKSAISRGLVSKRDLLETVLLLRLPFLFPMVKGVYRKRQAAADISSPCMARERTSVPLLGLVPGACIADIGSSIEEVARAELRMAAMLEDSIAMHKVSG